MPTYQLQYYHSSSGQWRNSDFAGEYSDDSRFFAEVRDRLGCPHRWRMSDSDGWLFAPSQDYPCRWQWGNAASQEQQYSDRVGNFSVPNPLINTRWPIFDLLTRTIYRNREEFLYHVESENTMPTAVSSGTQPLLPSSTTPTPNSSDSALVDIRVTRDEGKLVLTVNATNLHALLDSVGCRTSGQNYVDQPDSSNAFIANNKINTRLLLRKEYPVKLLLSQFFSTPPTLAVIKELCESGHQAVQRILAHYQPVDIKYTINKMVR